MPRHADEQGHQAKSSDHQPEEAARFLGQFSGSHTFQTFNDRSRKNAQLNRVLHDPTELKGLNAQGAGVAELHDSVE